MSVAPVKPPPQATPVQPTQPQPVKRDNDHDGDEGGAAKSSPPRHVGGLVDKDA